LRSAGAVTFGRVVWLTPYKRAPPARELPHQFRSLSVKMVRAYAWRKNGPVAFLLLRSLKVIKTDMNQLGTCDFLLMFHSNHGLILYHFQHITRQCYRATLCVSAVFAVVRCPSVHHIGGLYPYGWSYHQTSFSAPQPYHSSFWPCIDIQFPGEPIQQRHKIHGGGKI